MSYKVRIFLELEFTKSVNFFLKNFKHPHITYTKFIMKSGSSSAEMLRVKTLRTKMQWAWLSALSGLCSNLVLCKWLQTRQVPDTDSVSLSFASHKAMQNRTLCM